MIQAVPAKRVRVSAVMFRIVRGPVFLAAVWGDDQEQADQTIAFQIMDEGALSLRFDVDHRASSRPVGIDQAMGFQSSQPHPAGVSNWFEVIQAAVPTIENYILWHEAAPMRHLQQCPEMIVLGQGIRANA